MGPVSVSSYTTLRHTLIYSSLETRKLKLNNLLMVTQLVSGKLRCRGRNVNDPGIHPIKKHLVNIKQYPRLSDAKSTKHVMSPR